MKTGNVKLFRVLDGEIVPHTQDHDASETVLLTVTHFPEGGPITDTSLIPRTITAEESGYLISFVLNRPDEKFPIFAAKVKENPFP